MPRQDAQGRWVSDDGLTFWDGTAWRPLGAQLPAGAYPMPAQRKSPWPAILVGCGIALLVVIVLGIVGVFALISNPDFQRSFCNNFANSNPNQTCPFTPSSP
ncbi:MAG: hypothetical protein QOI23_2341 [Chloroflexota bacterium]|nr:hypothetical protein [Chloroflexota bacterium]